MTAAQAQPLRPIQFGSPTVDVEHRPDGVMLLRPREPLAAYPERLSDRLDHWAAAAPDRVFLAERAGETAWRSVTYATARAKARAIAGALLERGLSPERPLMILSGNGIDHGLMALAALYAGIPVCPVSPAYSLVSKDFGKLRHAVGLLTPGLVFVDKAAAYATAIDATVPAGTEVVAATGEIAGRAVTPLAALLARADDARVEAARAAVHSGTIAKFLLTSGSTGMPKAVINTQRMLCANQVMLRETLAFLKHEPPVIIDWLPWNHTFGGNHNVGLVLFNGGSLYIDDGKPTPDGIAATVRNLREIAPTVYFNVPKGYEALVAYLSADASLRRSFFSRLNCLFFAGASLARHVWDALDQIAIAETGARIPMLTGLGATETAPFCMSVTPQTSRSGHVGLPVAGNEIKLVPSGNKLEVRVRGPNVTPGYWRQQEMTEKAFDEEGFYKFGDALKPVDPTDFSKGFDFDGRIAEDFKLATGTWVSVGPLRAQIIAACAPLVRDVVIAGIDRQDLSAIVILDLDGVRAASPHLSGVSDLAAITADPALRAAVQARLAAMAASASGSATRVVRAILMDVPPSIDRGEITDKGSINQRAVLECRQALVEDLYAPVPSARVIRATE
ncbi:feruloyl-CoA synthase [Phreatobacter stygius]|uniref:Feruloyl-CoA synthase n=1 Tax=Phreatobacter stygius TaxID=1940610 RepID=A0A4D7BAL5_9HYPH|nr:feruloyl-CoA synthase [Phreatobacter stygius]QCI65162.1 feruloyl-CoA synthase [Phreatobacter stygius]